MFIYYRDQFTDLPFYCGFVLNLLSGFTCVPLPLLPTCISTFLSPAIFRHRHTFLAGFFPFFYFSPSRSDLLIRVPTKSLHRFVVALIRSLLVFRGAYSIGMQFRVIRARLICKTKPSNLHECKNTAWFRSLDYIAPCSYALRQKGVGMHYLLNVLYILGLPPLYSCFQKLAPNPTPLHYLSRLSWAKSPYLKQQLFMKRATSVTSVSLKQSTDLDKEAIL